MTDKIAAYRARAQIMRQQAGRAASPRGRFVYLEMAAYWEQLADMAGADAPQSRAARPEPAARGWPPP